MPVDELNLKDVKSLREALGRIPNGQEAAELAAALGLWTSSAHKNVTAKTPFPKELAALSPPELSDLSARVVSDAGRVVELVGLLKGLNDRLKMRLKQSQAQSRAANRRSWPDDKKAPTLGELNDLVENDGNVREITEQMGMLSLLLAMSEAQRDAMFMYRDAISREITFRCSQIDARIY